MSENFEPFYLFVLHRVCGMYLHFTMSLCDRHFLYVFCCICQYFVLYCTNTAHVLVKIRQEKKLEAISFSAARDIIADTIVTKCSPLSQYIATSLLQALLAPISKNQVRFNIENSIFHKSSDHKKQNFRFAKRQIGRNKTKQNFLLR